MELDLSPRHIPVGIATKIAVSPRSVRRQLVVPGRARWVWSDRTVGMHEVDMNVTVIDYDKEVIYCDFNIVVVEA
jgi:hypothetical protein